jgi:hypothetical protein
LAQRNAENLYLLVTGRDARISAILLTPIAMQFMVRGGEQTSLVAEFRLHS